ncbi:fimbria/pilus outer membrane usher protein [Escherichia coli]
MVLLKRLAQKMQKSKTRRGCVPTGAVMPCCLMPPNIGKNRVALDTNTLADNVDLDNAVANVVPTRGAIVRAEFKARVGIKLLMTLTHNNKPLPFGAMVALESSRE